MTLKEKDLDKLSDPLIKIGLVLFVIPFFLFLFYVLIYNSWRFLQYVRDHPLESITAFLFIVFLFSAISWWDKVSFFKSVKHGDTARVIEFLKHGADVNARDKYGSTPLHWATYYGHVEVVRLLLEWGADPTVRDKDGKSPLDVARERGQDDVARIIEEFIASRQAILDVEAPELYAGKWDARALCPACGDKLVFIKTLNRYYCFKCKDYR